MVEQYDEQYYQPLLVINIMVNIINIINNYQHHYYQPLLSLLLVMNHYYYQPLSTLWWTNIAMENHHAINGKIHYFYGHFPLLC